MLQFGKSAKGKVIHVVVLQKNALCDKKQTGLVIDKSLNLKDVTCAKCKQYKVFKDALTEEAKEEKMKHDLLVVEETKEEKKESKKKVQKTQKEKETKAVLIKKPVLDFQKEKRTDGTFQIIHISSGLHFFDKIEKDVVDRALSRLNKIEIKWETGFDKPPKDFISRCRKALRIAYKQAGIEIPNGLTKQNDPVEDVKKEKKEKKKTKKEEKTKKIIKRRDKKTGKDKKDKKDKKKTKRQIGYEFIQEQMVKGISISDLIDLLTEEFDLSSKKANSKMKGNIRRMRKEGIEIMIRLTKKKEDDFYKIVK